MKNYLKNLAAIGFLALFLPYTVTLLVNGREGIHQTNDWTDLEYRVLDRMMDEELAWMDEDLLSLMAVIFRTECMAQPEEQNQEEFAYTMPESGYEKIIQAVQDTQGTAVTVGGAYRELPYHAVSAGCTRNGSLLGEEYGYVMPVECPDDLEAESYLQIFTLTQPELESVLGSGASVSELEIARDAQGYVTRVEAGEAGWTGENFRTLLHLPSSYFRIEDMEGEIRVTVKGNGHGFGISLYTAACMLEEGASIEEVMQKFYENAECITIP